MYGQRRKGTGHVAWMFDGGQLQPLDTQLGSLACSSQSVPSTGALLRLQKAPSGMPWGSADELLNLGQAIKP